MAEAIENELGLDVELEAGGFHSFDVLLDDDLIFSMQEEKRFPTSEEIIESIRAYLERQGMRMRPGTRIVSLQGVLEYSGPSDPVNWRTVILRGISRNGT